MNLRQPKHQHFTETRAIQAALLSLEEGQTPGMNKSHQSGSVSGFPAPRSTRLDRTRPSPRPRSRFPNEVLPQTLTNSSAAVRIRAAQTGPIYLTLRIW